MQVGREGRQGIRRSMEAIAGGWHLDVKSFWLHRVGNEEKWLSAIAELSTFRPALLYRRAGIPEQLLFRGDLQLIEFLARKSSNCQCRQQRTTTLT